MIYSGFSFYLAYAAYLYGDEILFSEAFDYFKCMKRTHWSRNKQTLRYILSCFDVIFAFRNDRITEGIRKYDEVINLKPPAFHKANQKAAENLTVLMDGVYLFHSDKLEEAKVLLLKAYEEQYISGIYKSFCSLYLSRIFSAQNRPDLAKEMEMQAVINAEGTLFVEKVSELHDLESSVHMPQDSVAACRICNIPIGMNCINDYHDQLCTNCYKKLTVMNNLQAKKKDCLSYLISCTAVIIVVFVLFSFWMNSIYTNDPEFFSVSNRPYPWNVILFSGLYSLIICGLLNGIWLFSKFIKNRSKSTKIIFAVLSIITFALIYIVGVILLVPTCIFYICYFIITIKKLGSTEHIMRIWMKE